MAKEKTVGKAKEKEKGKVAEAKKCNDVDCPFHGNLSARGRIFHGKVTRKNPRRIMINFEGSVYVHKYERYAKSRSKIHARLPKCMEEEINIGDEVKIQECRPLSKIIHFVVTKKINKAEGEKK